MNRYWMRTLLAVFALAAGMRIRTCSAQQVAYAPTSSGAYALGPPEQPQINPPATSADLAVIYRRLEQQEAELRALRAQLQQAENVATPLPPVDSYAPASSLRSVSATSPGDDVAERLSDAEQQLKKIAAAEKKKKEDDASKPSTKLRGRIHADTAWFGQTPKNRADLNVIAGPPNGDLQDGSDFRRARIGAQGTAFELCEYIFEVDFGLSQIIIQDAFVGVRELPLLGTVRMGQFREPFGLEPQTSSNYITFLERGLTEPFDPSRNFGTGAFNMNEEETMTWAYGVFRTGSDAFGSDVGDEGELAFTTRVTWLPYYDEPSDGRYFVHLGGAFSHRDTDEGEVRIAGLPEVRMGSGGEGTVPFFVDTGDIPASDFQLYDAEAAWVNGSFSCQGEFACATVDADAGGTLFWYGAYAYVSYVLTGESRPYDHRRGSFGRLTPYENFFLVRSANGEPCCGRGAWEVAARWSYINLDQSPNIGAGAMTCYTLGLNWYWNAYIRLMTNIVFVNLDNVTLGESTAQVYSSRVQIDW